MPSPLYQFVDIIPPVESLLSIGINIRVSRLARHKKAFTAIEYWDCSISEIVLSVLLPQELNENITKNTNKNFKGIFT